MRPGALTLLVFSLRVVTKFLTQPQKPQRSRGGIGSGWSGRAVPPLACCFPPTERVASLLAGLPQVALVQWTESVGLTLVSRDLASMQLRTPGGQILTYCILQMFPFTSESKRMGVIVRVDSPLALPWACAWLSARCAPHAGSPGCFTVQTIYAACLCLK